MSSQLPSTLENCTDSVQEGSYTTAYRGTQHAWLISYAFPAKSCSVGFHEGSDYIFPRASAPFLLLVSQRLVGSLRVRERCQLKVI